MISYEACCEIQIELKKLGQDPVKQALPDKIASKSYFESQYADVTRLGYNSQNLMSSWK